MKLLLYIKPQWRGSAFGMSRIKVDRDDRWNDFEVRYVLYYRHFDDDAEIINGSSFKLWRIRKYG